MSILAILTAGQALIGSENIDAGPNTVVTEYISAGGGLVVATATVDPNGAFLGPITYTGSCDDVPTAPPSAFSSSPAEVNIECPEGLFDIGGGN